MKPILSVLLIALFFTSCLIDKHPDKKDIIIRNNSKEKIFAFFNNTDSLDPFLKQYTDSQMLHNYCAYPGSYIPLYEKPTSWKEYIENCHQQKLRIFVVTSDLVNKYGWKNIISKSIIGEKYCIEYSKLDSLNWTITYP